MDNFALTGKTALVTGVSRGLGQAMAVALARAGADIVGVGLRGLGDTEGRIQALGRRTWEIQADLADSGNAAAVAEQALALTGGIDILVNNAGVIKLAPAEDHSLADYDTVMNVNLRAVFALTQPIAKAMMARGGGKIINVCSIQSLVGGGGDAAYVASKHALHGLTRAWANEWGRHNIQVNAIAPGYMITDNTANLRKDQEAVAAITARVPLGRWGRPEDLMGPVVFLASAASDFVTGHLLVCDGGYLNA